MKMTLEKLACKMRMMIYQKFQTVPVSYFAKNKMGEMLSKTVTDTLVFTESVKFSLDIVREPITAIALLELLFIKTTK